MEAHTAAALLGIPRDRQIFLGYPDRDVLSLPGSLTFDALLFQFNGSGVVPYDSALYLSRYIVIFGLSSPPAGAGGGGVVVR